MQQTELLCIFGAGGNFGVADQLEDAQRIFQARQQFLASAARRD